MLSPGELWMFLDDFIEGGEDRGDGVVARPDVPLRIPARQLLYQVAHRIFPCKQLTVKFTGFERYWLLHYGVKFHFSLKSRPNDRS